MKKLALGMMLLVGGGLGWRAMHNDAPDPKLIFDRFWIDHMPRSPDEKFQPFFINSEVPFGRFVVRTQWTGAFEEFHYHVIPREPGVLDLLFGATREIQRVRYTARPCHENGFDYCLDLAGTSRGVKRYYSKKEWGPAHSEAEGLAKLHLPE
jgi:hypothetical protein